MALQLEHEDQNAFQPYFITMTKAVMETLDVYCDIKLIKIIKKKLFHIL